MADEQITVEWIATAQQMLTTIQKVDARLDKQEKAMQKLATTSKKGADAAAGSFNALEAVLKKNEAALRDMSVGSADFAKQKAKVEQLREAHKKLRDTISGGGAGGGANAATAAAKGSLEDLATQLKSVQAQLQKTAAGTSEYAKLERATAGIKKRHDELAESIRNIGKTAPVVVKKTEGSFAALSDELREAETELQGLVAGTAAFEKQKTKVDKLRTSLDAAAKNMKQLKQETVHAAGSFNKLEKELQDNEDALKEMVFGTKAFAEQKAKVDALRGSLNRVKTEINGVQSGESTFSGIKTGILGATGAAVALVAILKQVADAQRDIVNTGADAAVELDTLARKFQIQAGLNDPQRQAATVKILEQSSAAGVKAESGFQAATQLAGSGFDNAIESGALQTILDTMQAGSFQGDAAQLVSAFSQVMNASGIEKTNDNLKSIAVAAQSLFKKTDFQLTDLSEFAAIGATMKAANVDINEGIAAFTTLRDSLPAGESATGLRNLVTKMQKGDITKEGKEDLKRLGVKAADVDFVGESLTQVLTNLKNATDKMGEADRNAALGKLFGTENVTTARMLINSVPRINELQAQQKNKDQFEIDRATAAGGMQAGRNRLENKELIDMLPRGEKLNELDMEIRQRDARQKELEQRAATEIGPAAATAMRAGGGVLNTIDTATGADTMGGAMRGETMSTSFGVALGKWFFRSDEKQDEQIRLQREANELARANAQRPAAPQRPGLPAARPREAPLPGALQP